MRVRLPTRWARFAVGMLIPVRANLVLVLVHERRVLVLQPTEMVVLLLEQELVHLHLVVHLIHAAIATPIAIPIIVHAARPGRVVAAHRKLACPATAQPDETKSSHEVLFSLRTSWDLLLVHDSQPMVIIHSQWFISTPKTPDRRTYRCGCH